MKKSNRFKFSDMKLFFAPLKNFIIFTNISPYGVDSFEIIEEIKKNLISFDLKNN